MDRWVSLGQKEGHTNFQIPAEPGIELRTLWLEGRLSQQQPPSCTLNNEKQKQTKTNTRFHDNVNISKWQTISLSNKLHVNMIPWKHKLEYMPVYCIKNNLLTSLCETQISFVNQLLNSRADIIGRRSLRNKATWRINVNKKIKEITMYTTKNTCNSTADNTLLKRLIYLCSKWSKSCKLKALVLCER